MWWKTLRIMLAVSLPAGFVMAVDQPAQNTGAESKKTDPATAHWDELAGALIRTMKAEEKLLYVYVDNGLKPPADAKRSLTESISDAEKLRTSTPKSADRRDLLRLEIVYAKEALAAAEGMK